LRSVLKGNPESTDVSPFSKNKKKNQNPTIMTQLKPLLVLLILLTTTSTVALKEKRHFKNPQKSV
jgi:hypothetical protein